VVGFPAAECAELNVRDAFRAAAIVASLTFSADLQAQTAEPDSALIGILEEAAVRQSLLRLTAPHVLEGRVSDFVDGTVRFRTGDTIAARLIRQVDMGVQKRSGAIPGALIGAVLLGPSISHFLLDDGRGIEIFDVSLVGLAAGGVLGGLAGALVKPARDGWETVWTSHR
jgi:hypothetical protein